MKNVILIIAVFFALLNCKSQKQEILQVKPQEIQLTGDYRFPKFIQGTVYFKNGNTSAALLNFNLQLEEMHFIDNSGDTLAISDPELISSIVLDTVSYYYLNKQYLEIYSKIGPVEIAGKSRLKKSSEKIGAYNQESPTGSIDTYRSINDRGKEYQLSTRENVNMFMETTYYFIDTNLRVIKASKAAVLKLFPDRKENIEKYCKENDINFNSRPDIQQLLLHLNRS